MRLQHATKNVLHWRRAYLSCSTPMKKDHCIRVGRKQHQDEFPHSAFEQQASTRTVHSCLTQVPADICTRHTALRVNTRQSHNPQKPTTACVVLNTPQALPLHTVGALHYGLTQGLSWVTGSWRGVLSITERTVSFTFLRYSTTSSRSGHLKAPPIL